MKHTPTLPLRRASSLLVLLVVAVLVLGTACGGGGGGGGGGPTQPPPPAAGLTFTPSGGGGNDAVVLRRQGAGSDTLVLEVTVEGVEGLYGLFFDLRYPDSLLDFEGATEGPFLGADGQSTVFELAEEPGNLVVGLSRLGDVAGRSGTGVVLTLRFRAAAAGNGSLAFERNGAISANGQPLDLSWVGGTLQITR